MQTNLADFIRDTPQGAEADAVLRRCVHCGFCNATCPTYQLLGDELDGPRGRIYLIKQVLEGEAPTASTQLHLDRCLTCRNCETTCPSGVEYGRLVDIGRAVVAKRVRRSWRDRLQRRLLAFALRRRALFAVLVNSGRLFEPLLPATLASKLPSRGTRFTQLPVPRHARRMLALAGCVQPSLSPETNEAAARLLDRLGISLVEAFSAGCCGALRFHLDYQQQGLADMRRLIDAWWPTIEEGVEAIVVTASGCGVTVKDYGRLLAHDPAYRDKAARVSALARDLSEVLAEVLVNEREALAPLLAAAAAKPRLRAAFHAPCTLQHGQKLGGAVESLLSAAGFELTLVPDAHLCCGSAGTYSLTQPQLSQQLKANKLAALQSGAPQVILSANIGCQNHLASGSGVPVRHWIDALESRLT